MKPREVLIRGNGYYFSILTKENDVEMAQKLCEKSSDYFELAEGKPTSSTAGQELFTDLPPGKVREDKMILGIFNQNHDLIGIVDIVKNYPTRQVWFIGLMLLEPGQRNKGLGKEVFKRLSRWTYSKGVKLLKLAVLEENQRGYIFWQSLGFQTQCTKPYMVADKETIVYVMSIKPVP